VSVTDVNADSIDIDKDFLAELRVAGATGPVEDDEGSEDDSSSDDSSSDDSGY